MTTPNLKARFVTQAPSPQAAERMTVNRERFLVHAEIVDRTVPDSREKSLALTKLEEALYWANKAIIVADNANANAEEATK